MSELNKQYTEEYFVSKMKEIEKLIELDRDKPLYEEYERNGVICERLKLRKVEALNKLPNLYVYGNIGAGKTYNVKRISSLGEYVKWTEFYRAFQDENFNDRKYMLKKAPLLIIDDLGTSKFSVFQLEILFEIIDFRYENKKKTIITTNLNKEQLHKSMSEFDELQAQRIIDRIKSFKEIKFISESKR